MNFSRRIPYLIGTNALLLVPIFSAQAQDKSTSKRPNIVIFLADDMGYKDAGFTGATDIKTPNLDALANAGVVFSQGYASHPFSGPSRAGILSGRYQQRFGFEENPAYDTQNNYMGICVDEVLFPARMQEVGYTTGGIGKWHLGASLPFHPNNRGFDYYYGFLGGGHDYFRVDLNITEEESAAIKNSEEGSVAEGYYQPLIENNKPVVFDGYITDVLSEKAVEFIDDNAEKPFLLYLAYNAPHSPLQAPEEDIARYSHIKDEKRRIYAAMVDVMDRGIGTVVESLKRNGLYENTIIFFMSDNGGPQGQGYTPHNGSDNGDFRGGKGQYYEGGIHIPFMLSWPAKIKAGTQYDYPVNTLDVSRTAVELAGGDALGERPMDGVNLIPYVTGECNEAPHEAIFWKGSSGSKFAVLSSDRVKYVRNKPQDTPQLYFLNKDVSETKDKVEGNENLVDELKGFWDIWDKGNSESIIPLCNQYHNFMEDVYENTTMPKIRAANRKKMKK